MSNKTKQGKKEIKVLVPISEDDHAGEGISAIKREWNKQKKEYKYTGYIWDVWNILSKKLEDRYNFKYTFLMTKSIDEIIDRVSNGENDLCVGAFNRTANREDLVNFSAPVILDANSVIYRKGTYDEASEFANLVYQMRYHLFAILTFGIVFGLILFLFNSGRSKHLTQSKIKGKTKNYLFRSIITGISSIFGEMGYLAERSTLNIKGILLVILLMAIASIFLMYIQAEITNILVKKPNYSITQENIKGKRLLALEGSNAAEELAKYGAQIDLVAQKRYRGGLGKLKVQKTKLRKKDTQSSIEQMIEIYMKNTALNQTDYKNTKRYDGCAISYLDGYPYTKQYPLSISPDFGYYGDGFISSQKNLDLNEDINIAISELKDSLELQKICRNYFGDRKQVPICD